MKFLYLVWSNLKRKKLRTGLTLMSILVAFILFSLLSALKLALTGGVLMADRLGIEDSAIAANYDPQWQREIVDVILTQRLEELGANGIDRTISTDH